MMAPFTISTQNLTRNFAPAVPLWIMDLEHPPDIFYKSKLISFYTKERTMQW